MPHMNIYQRNSAATLKKIMELVQYRESLVENINRIQKQVTDLDARIAALYDDTYTDKQTAIYVPQAFQDEVRFKSPSSIKRMATKGRNGGSRSRK